MQGKLASSQFDLGYTELFCIPEVTSVFISSCESVLEDSLETNQANRGFLHIILGKQNFSACNAGESGLISWRRGSLMGFLELQHKPGVNFRVKARMSIRNSSLFSEVWTHV